MAVAPHVVREVRLPHAQRWSTIAWHGSFSGHFAGAWHAAVQAWPHARFGLLHVFEHVPHSASAPEPPMIKSPSPSIVQVVSVPGVRLWQFLSHRWKPQSSKAPHALPQETDVAEHRTFLTAWSLPHAHGLIVRYGHGGQTSVSWQECTVLGCPQVGGGRAQGNVQLMDVPLLVSSSDLFHDTISDGRNLPSNRGIDDSLAAMTDQLVIARL